MCTAGVGNIAPPARHLFGKLVFLYKKVAGNGTLPFG
jgi:hypothetical protein